MRIIKLVISFDGTSYCGWQRQDNGPTIQEELERAVSLITNQPTRVHGAGRTDAGVHALGMTAHFRTESNIELKALLKGLNSILPEVIAIPEVSEEAPDFHARFSARAKTYRYTFYNGIIECPVKRLYRTHVPFPLSVDKIESCLQVLTGTHDFGSFEASGSRDRNYHKGRGAVRTIFSAELSKPEPDLFHVLLTGDGFLRHMVRNIVGTVLDVGRGKISIEKFRDILEKRDRHLAGATAPAQGLTLVEVHYGNDWAE
jgi:tRNA pseudouridine38-40 synthase